MKLKNYNSLKLFKKIHFITILSTPSFLTTANLGARKDAAMAAIKDI